MTQQTSDYMQTLNEISQHVLLVCLRVSWPKFRYQISDAIVEVDLNDGSSEKATVNAEFRSNPQWQLMPDDWRKKFGRIEHNARTTLASASVSFGARGMSVLPISRAETIFSALVELREQMEQYKSDFTADYAAILDDMRARLGEGLFSKVRAKLPDPRTVADKFNLSWAIIPVGGMDGVSVGDIVTIETALNDAVNTLRSQNVDEGVEEIENALVVARNIRDRLTTNVTKRMDTDAASDLIADARLQTREMVQELLQNMATEPRRILAEATAKLVEALQSPLRHVRTGTIRQVREAFELVEGFSFMADQELLQAMQECRRRLDDTSAHEINSDENVSNNIIAGLQLVHEQAMNINAGANIVRSPRKIRV